MEFGTKFVVTRDGKSVLEVPTPECAKYQYDGVKARYHVSERRAIQTGCRMFRAIGLVEVAEAFSSGRVALIRGRVRK